MPNEPTEEQPSALTPEEKPAEDIKSDDAYRERVKQDFAKDLEHRRYQHRKNNFHYLQYKGILWLNSIYGADYMKSIGLQVHIPRTFMTIESIRPYLSGRPLEIDVQGSNRKEYENSKKAMNTLKAEWKRSGADYQKADAEFYALIFGTGFLLSKFEHEVEQMPLYDGVNEEDGKIKWKDGDFTRYQGMKLKSLNPYNVFPDHTATTEEEWGHCFVYSLWDYARFEQYCKNQGFNTDGLDKGGHLEEFDVVRRRIDMIYGGSNVNLTTRDNGQVVTGNLQVPELDMENKIMVVERFSNDEYAILAGANWTIVHRDKNPDPDKIIPIKPIRDYRVPDEFDGIGEAEVMRWQQYEENKVHNLTYMATLMSTIQRYGVIEEMLEDPTEASFNNPLKWIRMKNVPGADINKAMMPLNKQSANDVPLKFLQVIDQVRQEATGVSAYLTSSPDSQVNTLGEANIMRAAGLERIKEKIFNIEERDIAPILLHWLVCIPQYYTEEMDFLLNDGQDFYVRYVPYDRQFNTDITTVAALSVEYGIHGARTIEEVFIKMGYKDVVFVSDIIGGYNIVIKTATGIGDREKTVTQLNTLLKSWSEINKAVGYQAYDLVKLGADIGRQFPDVIKNVEEYKLPPPQQVVPGQVPGQQVPGQMPGGAVPTNVTPGAVPPTLDLTAPVGSETQPIT